MKLPPYNEKNLGEIIKIDEPHEKGLKALTNVRIFLGISMEKRRKMAVAGLREGYC